MLYLNDLHDSTSTTGCIHMNKRKVLAIDNISLKYLYILVCKQITHILI